MRSLGCFPESSVTSNRRSTTASAGGLLEAPQYTRPAEFRGWKVPDILLSGHHAEIAAWRRREAERRTRENRPDLLASVQVPENRDCRLASPVNMVLPCERSLTASGI